MRSVSCFGALAALLCVVVASRSAADFGSAFTYQGRLDQNGAPLDGSADLQFRLYDAATVGNQVGPTVVLNGTAIVGGLFTVTLDFGIAALSGDSRWIEVTVNGLTLAPRQAVTPVPYAVQTRGLFADDSGRVGVGTTAPAAKLDVAGTARAGTFELSGSGSRLHAGPQSQFIAGWDPNIVAGLDSAFLETAASVGPAGGLYVDAATAAIWNNGSHLLRLYNSATLPGGAPRFVVDALGRIGVGTASPAWVIDTVAAQSTARLLSTSANFGSVLVLSNATAGPQGLGAINFENSAAQTVGQILYIDNGLGTANDFIRITSGGVAVADLGPSALALFRGTSIHETNFQPLNILRYGSDGLLVHFFRENVPVGSISVAGGVVSYNAFTGSHYGWTDESPARGELMRLTGDNRRLAGAGGGEVVYGIRRTTEPNDRACLGAYLGLLETTRPADDSNPHLVMAEGNGELWVVDTGRDIEPGDALVSADLPGRAMLDDPERFPVGHIVARAAERVRWSGVPAAGGVRTALVSVLFAPAIRDGGRAASQEPESVDAADSLAAQLDSLRTENERLAGSIAELAEALRRQERELEALRSQLAAPASREASR